MEVKNKFNTVKIATCNDAHKAEAVNQLFERSLLFNRSDDICGIVISKNDEKQFIPISAIPDNVNIEKRDGVVTLVENPVVDSITTKADHNGIDWKSQHKIAETSAERTIILLCTKNIENATNIGVIGGEILEVGEGIYGNYKISLTPTGSGLLIGATTFEQKAALVRAKYNGTYYYGIKFKSTVPANIYFSGWDHFPEGADAPLYTSYTDADLSEIIELGGGDSGGSSSGGMTEAEKAEISAMNTQINTNKNDIAALQTSVAGKADTGHTHTKSQITDFAHTHDDRYFTETEVTNKLAGKSDTGHTHTKSQITDFPTSLPANGGTADNTKRLNPFASWNNPYIYDETNGVSVRVYRIKMTAAFNSILVQIYDDINFARCRKYFLGLWHTSGYGYNVSVTDLGGTKDDGLKVWMGTDGNVYLQADVYWNSRIAFSYLDDQTDVTITGIGVAKYGTIKDIHGAVLFTPLGDPITDCGAIRADDRLSSVQKIPQILKTDVLRASSRLTIPIGAPSSPQDGDIWIQ